MYPHTDIYVLLCDIYVPVLLCVLALSDAVHNRLPAAIYVLVLLNMCPCTAIYVSSYYYMWLRTTTYVSSYYYIYVGEPGTE
jgi:Flp pilus assembly protein protease CpaA